MKLFELAWIAGGELRGPDSDFHSVGTDTRTLAAGDLYVALRGPRFDGNDYIAAAAQAGAVAALVERFGDCDLPQVRVDDTRPALGRLAAAWRARWSGKLVGITGSNGKTTIKELTAAILGVRGPTHKTAGNLNNDIGVPLTLLRLQDEQAFAVIEMGANHPGEIAYVAGLAAADVAILGNAGAAHLEGFGSLEGVARAKGEIIAALPETGVAILNADDRFFDYWRELAGPRAVLGFGFAPAAAVRAEAASIRMELEEGGFLTTFELHYQGVSHLMALRLAGRHNVSNALAAAAAALALGFKIDEIREGLERVRPVPGRLEPLRGRNGALVLHDAYNANPVSFGAALEVLAQLPGTPWVALGAFGELGETSAELHERIGLEAKSRGVERLFAVGLNADRAVRAFGAGGLYFREQDELMARMAEEITADVAVLVKGSRSQRMERVVEALREDAIPVLGPEPGKGAMPCC